MIKSINFIVFILAFVGSQLIATDTKTIYVYPGYWGDLFAVDNPLFNRDGCLEPMFKLKNAVEQEGYVLKQVYTTEGLSDFDLLIVFEIVEKELKFLKNYPKEKLILFLWEPPSVLSENYVVKNHDPFSKVFTWNDSLVDHVKYFKFNYPVLQPMIEDQIAFENKKLCTLVACNKYSTHTDELYSERKKVINFYEYNFSHDFDLYGKWWPSTYKTYQGMIDKKVDTLKYYRFCYSYENVKNIPGYITEKIFDCFHAGCVPIYWGAPNICDYVPKECFISRKDFKTHRSLYDYLSKMDKATYETYLENIKKFLESEKAQNFSHDTFVNTVMEAIKESI